MHPPTESPQTPLKRRKVPSSSRYSRNKSPGDELGKHKSQTSITNFFVSVVKKSEEQSVDERSEGVRKVLFDQPSRAPEIAVEPVVISDDDQPNMEHYHMKTKSVIVEPKRKISLSRKSYKTKSSDPVTSSKLPVNPPAHSSSLATKHREPEISPCSSVCTTENDDPMQGSPCKKFRKQKLSPTSQILGDTLNTQEKPQTVPCLVSIEGTTDENSTKVLVETQLIKVEDSAINKGSRSYKSLRQDGPVNKSSSPVKSKVDTIKETADISRTVRIKTECETAFDVDTIGVDQIDWTEGEEIASNLPLKTRAPQKPNQFQTTSTVSVVEEIKTAEHVDCNKNIKMTANLMSPVKPTDVSSSSKNNASFTNQPGTPSKPSCVLNSTSREQSSQSSSLNPRPGPSTPVKKSPYKRSKTGSPAKSPQKRSKTGSPAKSPVKVNVNVLSGHLVIKHCILECRRYAKIAINHDSNIKKFADSYMSLPDREKVLLHKLLVRKWSWIRLIDMKNYDTIVENLVGSLELLQEKGFLEELTIEEPLEVFLHLLKRPELEILCKNYEEKKEKSSKKENLVGRLCKFVNAQGSLGFTKKSLKSTLTNTAFNKVGKCVRVQEDARLNLQKIFETSMSPVYLVGQFYTFQDRLTGMGRLMSEVKFENKKLIPFALSDLQLFYLPAQFDEFIASGLLKLDILCAKDEKDTLRGVELAKDARSSLLVHLYNPEVKHTLNKIPQYLWKFTAGSNYTSALDVGIEFLKRKKDYNDALVAIDTLLSQGQFRKHCRGRWYAEKIMIMDKQMKASADELYSVLMAGLQEDLTPIGRLELSKKAEGVCNKKKGGLSKEQKIEIRRLMKVPLLNHGKKEIRGIEAPNVSTGTRQTFVEYSACGEKTYFSVEDVAKNSYLAEYPEGKHDEGSLIKNIILAAFWPIIYLPKENMFISCYQFAPLDWGTRAFYINRKEEIDHHIDLLKKGGVEGVMQQITEVVQLYSNYHSVINWFEISFDMLPTIKNVLTCLTLDKFLKIAEYLLESFRERRSGWPDLTLWNTVAGKFKLVEVKSPNDELSFKQIVWLEKFVEIGVDVEECRVNAAVKGRKRKAEPSAIPSDYSQEVM